MTSPTSALALMTALVVVLLSVLTFALVRFARAARDARRMLRDRDTERVFVASAMQDALSRLKAQEQAMSARAEASEHLSEQIVVNLTAGLLVVSSNRTVQMLNPAGQRLLAVDGDRQGTNYRELVANAPELAEVIDRCLITGKPILRQTLAIQLHGHTTYLGVTVSPIAAADSTPRGVICLFSDLTSVVELEEQLRLKATLARLGELTAGLAHEFRNGLATIHGYGRLIDPRALPTPYSTYVEGIRQETDSLQKVVTNFLNFARPEQIVFQPVDLGDLIRRAWEDVLPPERNRGELQVRGTFATVPADAVLLRQAFSNLLRNALEACEGAGVAPRVTVTGAVHDAAGVASICVDDNGPGIDEALAERVFAPFFTTKPQGTGLGLALVQKIVVTHNGRVTIGRAAGGGTRVQVTLPTRHADVALT